MIYFILILVLFVLEILYFKLANHFNITDKPNERSSHSKLTLRGGGIIFYFSALAFFLLYRFEYPWFFLGLTLMTLISFLDDVFTLSNKIRLMIHFVSVLLMALQLELFEMPWYLLMIGFIIVVGVINAYNFMDGINGITASYSLSVAVLLIISNYKVKYIEQDFLIYTILGVLVFGFFNFRTIAKCFAGDVGSVAISYILLFALGQLILKTENPIYILFLTVYGIDTVWTILNRLKNRENIFKAHRSHLYQYLVNEAGNNKLFVSFIYGFIQFIIGLGVLYFSQKDIYVQLIFAAIILLLCSIIYISIKKHVHQKYVLVKE